MILFSTRLTLYLCGASGLISFIMTAVKAFSGIRDFHGGWVEFGSYMANGLLDCLFNGTIVFCLTGLIALPILNIIEKKMLTLEAQKKSENKKSE
ncbi:MAG: hypothetical protein JW774_03400 [Candidatus Aureabacteria bacterium]|nr:hypothetical protein [Candidatus Auribacterota bacterium]